MGEDVELEVLGVVDADDGDDGDEGAEDALISWYLDASDGLCDLADALVRLWGRSPEVSPLLRAKAHGLLLELAEELVRDQVVEARRSRTWKSIGAAFGLSPQGAQQRWGR